MRKILVALMVPLLSITVFFGCTKSKVNLNDINAKYSSFTDKSISNDTYNQIFKNNRIKSTELNDEGDFDSETGLPTYQKVMYILYTNTENAKLDSAVQGKFDSPGNISEQLKVQYSQLLNVYQRILSLSYNYYANWANTFYTDSVQDALKPNELDNLNKKLEALEKSVDGFISSKISFEQKIENHGISNPLQMSEITSFNHEFNKVLLKSFNFINYFRDLHVKYVFNNDAITKSSAKRLVDDVLLTIAESIFYDNVLAFDRANRCDIYSLETDSGFKISNYNWLTKRFFKNSTIKFNNYGTQSNSNLNIKINETYIIDLIMDSNLEGHDRAVALVSDVSVQLESFKQNFSYYKTLFNSADLDRYNYIRELDVAPAFFDESQLSSSEIINFNFMMNFSQEKIFTMFNSLYTIMKINA